jgi:hypothetical protein
MRRTVQVAMVAAWYLRLWPLTKPRQFFVDNHSRCMSVWFSAALKSRSLVRASLLGCATEITAGPHPTPYHSFHLDSAQQIWYPFEFITPPRAEVF